MARILFVVPPLTGHTNPTLGVGAELLRRGHEVAWVGFESKLGGLPKGAKRFCIDWSDPAGVVHGTNTRSAELHGLRSVKFFFEEFLVPLARGMVGPVREVVETFTPDGLVVDQQALAGSFVARERGLPWISSCTTSASVVEPLDAFAKIVEWKHELLGALQDEMGLDRRTKPGLSPHGVLVFSSPALLQDPLPETVHFVGPVLTARPPAPFPWGRLDARRRVLVSLGTVSFARGANFYRAVVEGLGNQDLQVVLVAPESLVPEVPENFIRCDFVPQLELLPQMDAVVSHGGHNTVVETLAEGKPLVVAPIRDDQPVVAGQVVAAGAGIRLKFARAKAASLRAAVFEVLDNPQYRLAAERVQASLAAGGGAPRAATIIEAALGPQADGK